MAESEGGTSLPQRQEVVETAATSQPAMETGIASQASIAQMVRLVMQDVMREQGLVFGPKPQPPQQPEALPQPAQQLATEPKGTQLIRTQSLAPQQLKAQRKKGKKRSRSFSPSALSDSEAFSSDGRGRKRSKRKSHKGKSRRRCSRRSHRRRRRREALSSSDSSSSDSSVSSSSEREEGELSGEEEEEDHAARSDRLFPPEFLGRMLSKAAKAVNLEQDSEEPKPSCSSTLFPQGPSKSSPLPFPAAFQKVLESEWKAPTVPKQSKRLLTKFYALPDKALATLQLPIVDQPVAALSSSAVIPSEGEGGPRDASDKRAETAIKRDFQASSHAVRASSATSIMSRAAFQWTENLIKSEPDLPSSIKSTLRKIALASAFSADASLDALQFSARAMAASVAARRSIWLRSWQVDSSSQARLTALPFQGGKLFGQALEDLLVEGKDKRKVLPTSQKEVPRARGHSFRSFRREGRFRDGSKFGNRWNKPRFQPRHRGQGSGGNKPKPPKDPRA